jgi:predicted metal-dependent peptidase
MPPSQTSPAELLAKSTPQQKLAAVKILAMDNRPYFSAAYHALVPVEVEDKFFPQGQATMAVDKHWRLYWAPGIFDKWTIPEVAGVLYHELSHLLGEHFQRAEKYGEEFNQTVWMVATDCAINSTIQSEMDELAKSAATKTIEGLPKEGCLPEKCNPPLPKGQTAEFYYEELLKQAEKSPKFKAILEGMAANSDCGSGQHGQRCDHELATGANDDRHGGLSEADVTMVRLQVAHDIKEQAGKKAGSVPGGWERWADDIMQPQVDYMRWIRAAVSNAYQGVAGRIDYSWTRRHRQQDAYGRFIMPGMYAPDVNVGIVVDTSGSMSQDQISQCVAEIGKALSCLGNKEVVVASCDSGVHSIQRITHKGQLALRGGGGTDMGVGIAKLEEVRPKINLMILLTDCETPWPAKPPKAKLVLVKVEGSGAPPPWPCSLVEIDLKRLGTKQKQVA